MNFSTKVLSRFAATPGLKLEVSSEVPPGDAATEAKREETKAALRELGLAADLGPRQPSLAIRDVAQPPCSTRPPDRLDVGEAPPGHKDRAAQREPVQDADEGEGGIETGARSSFPELPAQVRSLEPGGPGRDTAPPALSDSHG